MLEAIRVNPAPLQCRHFRASVLSGFRSSEAPGSDWCFLQDAGNEGGRLDASESSFLLRPIVPVSQGDGGKGPTSLRRAAALSVRSPVNSGNFAPKWPVAGPVSAVDRTGRSSVFR